MWAKLLDWLLTPHTVAMLSHFRDEESDLGSLFASTKPAGLNPGSLQWAIPANAMEEIQLSGRHWGFSMPVPESSCQG